MEEINHFGHEEHTLRLIENSETVKGVHCHGCQEPILDGSVYGCILCSYFLHKTCAELQPTLNHANDQHPLTLGARKNDWNCDLCNNEYKIGGFSYQCPECDFDACIKCGVAAAIQEAAVAAVKEKALIKLRHEGHPQHDLTLLIRPGAFYCNACKTEEKDFFYKCESCDFWIHERCANLPQTLAIPFHRHPLLLVFSLPERFYNFMYYCVFCNKRIISNDWIYLCANCRYLIHIKCALNIKQHPIPRGELADDDKDELADDDKDELADDDKDELADDDKDEEEKPDPLQLGDFEITHFSHKHPLAEIIGKPEKIGSGIVCSLCGEPLVDGSTYGCIKCHYFLHKACTQLEPTINHHFHPHEPLNFTNVRSLTWRYWYCDVCRLQGPYEGFCYSSSHEDKWLLFIACIACCLAERARQTEIAAIKEEAMIKLEHKSQHTLTLQLRPASFKCDACNSKEDGLFYRCDSCDFWIHKTCASLGPTLNLPHHPKHPLKLVYSIPENFYNFKYYCEFCKKYIRRNEWLYHCANCRYLAHVKCALNAEKLPILRDGLGTSAYNDFPHFPKSYVFTDPLKLLHTGKVDVGGDKAELNDHWSHNHPLILNVASSGNNMPNVDSSDSIEVCYLCVQPITHPYYSCKDGCSFNLHTYCAGLPQTIVHPLHPNHKLKLVNASESEDYYKCSGCFSNCNTFVYQCEDCEFCLDVNCAFLPKTIKHISHNHLLNQVFNPKCLCNACDNWFDGLSYYCKDCNFQLDMYCALRSPESLSHMYCKGHTIPLIYPPVENHPEDFYCDICEIEMHPKFPLYYCDKDKNSFHLLCLSPNYRFANVILEGTITVYYHKHPLTYARRKKTPQYICSVCKRDLNGHLILQCRARVCNFNICLPCHSRKTTM